MDRMIYIAMTGARHTMDQQTNVAHNLANASTTGFKAELDSFRALPVTGQGLQTRSFVVDSTVGADLTPGVVTQTGRELDVAVQGEGWIAVQTADGSEAYTRDGGLQVSPNGLLQTRNGYNVMGDAGPITIPPGASVTVGKDGTITAQAPGEAVNALAVVGRIRLVNPPAADLVKGTDGLFRTREGQAAPADARVALVSGHLENSNVNVVESLVSMISLGRNFEMQMKLLQNADQNARQASQLLSLA